MYINCLRAKMLQLRREHELLQKMFNYPAQCRDMTTPSIYT
jgi:hypothetical protein